MKNRRIAALACSLMALSAVVVGAPDVAAFLEAPNNSFFGDGAGASITVGGANAFFGGDTGGKTTEGAANAFFGQQAGEENVDGLDNTFIGAFTGVKSTTDENTFVGSTAGFNTTTGAFNAFFGSLAGFANTTGCCNSFFGREAGFANIGSGNSFFGDVAGRSNTSGASNAFFGSEAGKSNTTGSSNTFFGPQSGFTNTTASNGTIVGSFAGIANNGPNNTFVGQSAGSTNTSGSDNAFFGSGAGLSISTESRNVVVGAFADGAAGVSNATAVGHRAKVSQADSLVLGSIAGVNGAVSDVKVGIGTSTPSQPLHVRRTDGTARVLVEDASGTTLGRNLFQLTNNGASRFRIANTQNNVSWDFQTSGGGGSFVIDRVGGPASLDFEIKPNGDAVHLGTVTATGFITSSDRAKKTDITPAKASKLMALLRELDISTWRFKNQAAGTINLGPMAQDFHRLFGMGTDTTIDIRDLAALALVAAQVLDDQFRTQGSALDEIARDGRSKDARIAALEKAVEKLMAK